MRPITTFACTHHTTSHHIHTQTQTQTHTHTHTHTHHKHAYITPQTAPRQHRVCVPRVVVFFFFWCISSRSFPLPLRLCFPPSRLLRKEGSGSAASPLFPDSFCRDGRTPRRDPLLLLLWFRITGKGIFL
ncbi:hypothetical protein K431DRAFT_171508 [Polychaeton citri CBS 116435]|uniref:Uncharacterized protein n=1 Tax=Polychaeton citri CBS 116435 TaxID=1314669 RepID=A0A9P4PZL7_9PEZI|nr:hypothetical protein K431DRAFT_171508 [Polychaeton citri CBS 116435]